MKRLKKMDLFTVCNALIMTLVVLLSVYPLYYAVVNSLNDGTNTTNFGMVQLWPRQFSLDSWRMVVKDPAIPTALGITASRTVIVTVCQLIFTSMFAYAFSRPYLRFKKCYAALGFMSMYISGGIVATFLLLSKMGLYNTYWVYIIPSLFGGFYNAVIAALAVFTIVGVWNDYTTSLFYTSSTELQTLQYYIVKLVRSEAALEQIVKDNSSLSSEVFALLYGRNSSISARTLELAAMIIAAIPMIAIYPFAQKFFTKRVLVGSIKG